eukprot:scaffold27149_cov67-Phaeocystis_antarctica.AAC.3
MMRHGTACTVLFLEPCDKNQSILCLSVRRSQERYALRISYLRDEPRCRRFTTTPARPSPTAAYPVGDRCSPSGAQRSSPLLQLEIGWSTKSQRPA